MARLEAVLQPDSFDDYGPNGLQVRGREATSRIVTAVSASRTLFERAAQLDAGLVLVHHGMFWNGDGPGLGAVAQVRLRVLLGNELNLAAYHLPLDAHPQFGNNALLAEALGCDGHEEFAEIGRLASFDGGIPIEDLVGRVRVASGREPLLQGAGPALVRRLAVVSGAAASMLADAVAAGADAFLTGEPREHVMHAAEESGVHFIAAGHYATETFGVRAMGDLVAGEFGVEHLFVDLPNPV